MRNPAPAAGTAPDLLKTSPDFSSSELQLKQKTWMKGFPVNYAFLPPSLLLVNRGCYHSWLQKRGKTRNKGKVQANKAAKQETPKQLTGREYSPKNISSFWVESGGSRGCRSWLLPQWNSWGERQDKEQRLLCKGSKHSAAGGEQDILHSIVLEQHPKQSWKQSPEPPTTNDH